jgi:hypothetical protein
LDLAKGFRLSGYSTYRVLASGVGRRQLGCQIANRAPLISLPSVVLGAGGWWLLESLILAFVGFRWYSVFECRFKRQKHLVAVQHMSLVISPISKKKGVPEKGCRPKFFPCSEITDLSRCGSETLQGCFSFCFALLDFDRLRALRQPATWSHDSRTLFCRSSHCRHLQSRREAGTSLPPTFRSRC